MKSSLTTVQRLAVVLTAALVGGARADELRFQSRDGVLTLLHNDRLLLEYQAQPNPYKVYVSRWTTPQGVQILRDSPHDHVHHHALMFAVAIDEVDFWSEAEDQGPGKQVPRGTGTQSSLQNGRGRATIRQAIDWLAPDGTVLGREQRTVTAHVKPQADVALLSWTTELQPAAGAASAELSGRHYFGLGMRFVTAMDKQGRFLNASSREGKPVRGSEKLVRAAWCAYISAVDGKPVTVAMFDAPANPRHPATWFTMTEPFAYLAATIDLKSQPLTITSQKPFEARYGLALWDGERTAADIQRVYEAWLESR